MKMAGRIVILGLFSFAGCALAQNEIPDQGEYAWQFPVTTDQSAEYFEAQIPLGVYQSVYDSQLRDVGVYDANGRAVPRITRQEIDKSDDVEIRLALGIIPLYGELEQSPDHLKLLLESKQGSTRLQFDSGAAEQTDPEEQLQAYIVDLRELEDETFTALEFNWTETSSGFIGNVFIHQSDDLSTWRSLSQGTLAELAFEGTSIERNRIELARVTGDFLRIRWADMPAGWRLESVTGIRQERGPEQAREWQVLSPVSRSEDGREFTFDIGGFPPVDRVSLVLPGKNVVVRASVDARHGPETNWHRAYQGLFYNINRNNHEITTVPARLNIYRASQWKVRINTGRVDGDVKLRLGWRPEQLIFLNQGEPPFTVVSGRSRDSVENFPQHRLLGDASLFNMLLDSVDSGAATIGERTEAAGMMALESARTWTWRTVLVWIGLVGAVLFVGWLAFSLMQENKKGPEG